MLHRVKKSGCAALAAVAAATVLAAAPSQAVTAGLEGCTPGYWKNHTENWLESPGNPISTETLFTSVYTGAAGLQVLSGVTFLQALQGGGGAGVDGAALILARAATAAYLNAAHDDLGFPWRRDRAGIDGRPALIKAVNAAFASGSRSKMLALAQRLDQDNNLGCPLS